MRNDCVGTEWFGRVWGRFLLGWFVAYMSVACSRYHCGRSMDMRLDYYYDGASRALLEGLLLLLDVYVRPLSRSIDPMS